MKGYAVQMEPILWFQQQPSPDTGSGSYQLELRLIWADRPAGPAGLGISFSSQNRRRERGAGGVDWVQYQYSWSWWSKASISNQWRWWSPNQHDNYRGGIRVSPPATQSDMILALIVTDRNSLVSSCCFCFSSSDHNLLTIFLFCRTSERKDFLSDKEWESDEKSWRSAVFLLW